jgi:hypothetical protein
MAARWESDGAQTTASWWKVFTALATSGGAAHQPIRQPVMEKLLDRLLTVTQRSSRGAMDGAGPSNTMSA